MPIYEYTCEKCGKIVEQIQKVTDPAPKKHEGCGGRLTKVMSRSSFQLKGGGWYKDLYSSTPDKKSGASDSSSDTPVAKKSTTVESKAPASSESKSESKSVAKESKPAAASSPKSKK